MVAHHIGRLSNFGLITAIGKPTRHCSVTLSAAANGWVSFDLPEMPQDLASWLREGGGEVHAALELFRPVAGDERGVFATDAIAVGETLLRVPRGCALSPEASLPAAVLTSSEFASLPSVARTALALLAEQSRGSRSPFHAYLSRLPTEYPLPERWTAAERALLGGTTAGDQLAHAPAETVLWELQAGPVVTSTGGVWARDTSAEQFVDACAAVRTRAFRDDAEGDDGTLHLVPAVDMLNCEPARWQGGSPATTLRIEGDDFVMRAERPIAPDEEVRHCYDALLSDAEMLLQYGFVRPSCGHSASSLLPTPATLECDAIVEACSVAAAEVPVSWNARELWDEKRGACEALVAPSGRVAVSEADPLPDAFVTIPQLMLMPADAFRSLRDEGSGNQAFLLDASAIEESDDDDGEDEFRDVVLRALSLTLTRRLARFACDAAEDDAALATPAKPNCRRYLACRLRVAERRAVLAAQREVLVLASPSGPCESEKRRRVG